MVGRDLDRLVDVREGELVQAELDVDGGAAVEGLDEFGAQIDRLVEIRNRLLVVALLRVLEAAIVERGGELVGGKVAGVDRPHAIVYLLIHESPRTDALFLLVSKSDEVTTT